MNHCSIEPMQSPFPSDSELDALARQVDEQFQALKTSSSSCLNQEITKGLPPDIVSRIAKGELIALANSKTEGLPSAPEQLAVIERVTGERFDSFWDKFKRHLRKDLCLPGGMLYKQWHDWKDLKSKDTVKVAYGVLVGMGVSTAAIGPMAVAASVFVLNVLTKVGIEAICEDCAREEAASKSAAKKDSKLP